MRILCTIVRKLHVVDNLTHQFGLWHIFKFHLTIIVKVEVERELRAATRGTHFNWISKR